MSYPSFPSIQKPSYGSSNEEVYPDYDKAVISSDSDGGYTVTRPRYTRTQMGHQYYWPAMSAADYAQFRTFVIANMAGIFVWTDPETGVTSSVRLSAKPQAKKLAPNIWEVTISIREV